MRGFQREHTEGSLGVRIQLSIIPCIFKPISVIGVIVLTPCVCVRGADYGGTLVHHFNAPQICNMDHRGATYKRFGIQCTARYSAMHQFLQLQEYDRTGYCAGFSKAYAFYYGFLERGHLGCYTNLTASYLCTQATP